MTMPTGTPAITAASRRRPAPARRPSTWSKIWNWIKKNWWKTLLAILAILVFFAIVVPLGRIGWLKYNAWITGMNSSISPAAGAPAAPVTTGSSVVSESTVLDLGSIGAFHAVYDAKVGKYTLGIWDESATRLGTGLDNFKKAASSVTFTMPADGTINNSAGHIAVDSVEWTLGNPATDKDGNSLIKKGQSVTIFTDGPNLSAGFQIWFN